MVGDTSQVLSRSAINSGVKASTGFSLGAFKDSLLVALTKATVTLSDGDSSSTTILASRISSEVVSAAITG